MELLTHPEYKKVDLNAADVGLMHETLWLRADDIPMPTPVHRIVFHTVLLLLANGFRSGMVMDAKYRDFELAIVRDPETAQGRGLFSLPLSTATS